MIKVCGPIVGTSDSNIYGRLDQLANQKAWHLKFPHWSVDFKSSKSRSQDHPFFK